MHIRFNKTSKQFISGFLLAGILFEIYNILIEFYIFTWQEMLLSLIYGAYNVLLHYIMKKHIAFQTIAIILLVIEAVIIGIWFFICLMWN